MVDSAKDPISRRIAITAALVGVALGISHVPLAGIDRSAFIEAEVDVGNFSIGALGLMPALSAFVVVELGALLRERWRALRVSGPTGRAKLTRVAHALALVLATFQGWGVAKWLESVGGWGTDIVQNPGWGFELRTTMSLVAGTAFLMVIAGLIHRFGIGNGYSVLLLSSVGLYLAGLPASTSDETSIALVAGVVVGIVIAFSVLLSSHSPSSVPSASQQPYRAAIEPEASGTIVRPLPCGIVPMSAAASLLMLPFTIGNLLPVEEPITALFPGTDAYEIAGIVLVILGTLLFSRLFQAPARIAALRVRLLGRRAPGADETAVRTALSSQVLVAVVLLGALWWLGSWLSRNANVVLAVVEVAVAAAVTLDLVHEVRARHRLGDAAVVGAIHRVYEVDVALELLQREGIPAEPRTLHHRMLLQFFGPYLPVELLVPARRAKRARRLLLRLAEPGVSEPQRPDGVRKKTRRVSTRRRVGSETSNRSQT